MSQETEPLSPREAVGMYLQDRKSDVTAATLRSHKSRLSHFIDWCHDQDIDVMGDLNGMDLHRYKLWRGDDINKVTLKTQLDTLRVFIRWCEGVNAATKDLHTSVVSPSLDTGDNQRSDKVDAETATQILEYLRKYEYCSIRHALAELLWHCGLRVGGARAIDVGDVHLDEPAIEVLHRPDEDTPLKNKGEGERWVAISANVAGILEDWITDQHPGIEDDYGRTPLLATVQGRAHIETLRSYSYQLTRPCTYSEECPHDRTPDECEATEHGAAFKCPSSSATHAWRRGSITYHLRRDVPKTVVSDRVNASPKVLDKHYNEMTQQEKMRQRRDYLNDI